jgi:hypothetical protein
MFWLRLRRAVFFAVKNRCFVSEPSVIREAKPDILFDFNVRSSESSERGGGNERSDEDDCDQQAVRRCV